MYIRHKNAKYLDQNTSHQLLHKFVTESWEKEIYEKVFFFAGRTKGFGHKCTLLKHVQFLSYFGMAVGQFEALFQTLRPI